MGNKESTPIKNQELKCGYYTIENVFTKDITDKLKTLEEYKALYLILEHDSYSRPMIGGYPSFIEDCKDIVSIQSYIIKKYFNDRRFHTPYDKNRLIEKINMINDSILYAVKVIFYWNMDNLYEKVAKLKSDQHYVKNREAYFDKVNDNNYELCEENEKLEKQIKKLEDTIIKLENNKNVEATNKGLQILHSNPLFAKFEMDQYIESSKNQFKKLIEDNYELIEKNENSENTIIKLKEKNEDLKEKNEALIDTVIELEKNNKCLDDKNEVLQTKCDSLEEENAKLRERVKILDESNF